MVLEDKNRKIVYWGIGEVCKNCLKYHPEINPIFFIDSYSKLDDFENKKVFAPSRIGDWSKYFVVITVDNYLAIQDYLLSMGLIEGRDFCHYSYFFDKEEISTEKLEEKIYSAKNTFDENKSTLLMFMCMFIGRQSSNLQRFFRQYIQKVSDKYNIIVVDNIGSLSEERASQMLGCKVVDSPINIIDTTKLNNREEILSDGEIDYIEKIIYRKKVNRSEETVAKEIRRYLMYKNCVECICPEKILVWGGWSKDFYYLKHIMEARNIEYRVLEHGSIPGTIQADPFGIMGQSVYGKTDDILKNNKFAAGDREKYNQIRNCIIDNKMDTRVFKETLHDKLQMEQLDAEKKTIFLVGMDENGMSINSESDYWDSYVSDTYHSMIEVLYDLKKICDRLNFNLIYKPHPGNHVTDKELLNSGLIYVEDMSIDALIQKSDLVISMSSAVEFKVLMYEKPLLQIGFSSLWNKGCSYCLKEKELLGELVSKAIEQGMTDEQKINYSDFIIILLNTYFWDDLTDRNIRYGLTCDNDFFGME